MTDAARIVFRWLDSHDSKKKYFEVPLQPLSKCPHIKDMLAVLNDAAPTVIPINFPMTCNQLAIQFYLKWRVKGRMPATETLAIEVLLNVCEICSYLGEIEMIDQIPMPFPSDTVMVKFPDLDEKMRREFELRYIQHVVSSSDLLIRLSAFVNVSPQLAQRIWQTYKRATMLDLFRIPNPLRPALFKCQFSEIMTCANQYQNKLIDPTEQQLRAALKKLQKDIDGSHRRYGYDDDDEIANISFSEKLQIAKNALQTYLDKKKQLEQRLTATSAVVNPKRFATLTNEFRRMLKNSE